MRIIEYLVEKSEYLVRNFGQKILAAYKLDTLAHQRNPDATAEEIVSRLQQADIKNQYLQWIVRQYIKRDFRLEDLNRVKKAIHAFDQKKKSLPVKDIGQYKKLSNLEDTVESSDTVKSNREIKREIKTNQADKVLETSRYLVVHIKTEEAAKYYGKGTRWCTAAEQDCQFEDYDQEGPIYMIFDKKTNEKWQAHEFSSQFMDVADNPIDPRHLQELMKDPKLKAFIKNHLISAVGSISSHFTFEDAENSPKLAAYFFVNRGMEWDRAAKSAFGKSLFEIALEDPEAAYYVSQQHPALPPKAERKVENAVKKNPAVALRYAIDNKIRFPETEEEMSKYPIAAQYAIRVLERPWPAAEEAISKSAYQSYEYASRVIKGRWPKGEPAILKQYQIGLSYAKGVLKRRWPEFEKSFLEKYNPENVFMVADLYYYLVQVVKERGQWSEGENALLNKDSIGYAAKWALSSKQRWPEAEHLMKGSLNMNVHDYERYFGIDVG